jgi:hypothetical protein
MDYNAIKEALLAEVPKLEIRSLPYEQRYFARARHMAADHYALEVADPITDETLAIFAHEAGHIATNSWELDKAGASELRDEIEAWKWAKQMLDPRGAWTPAVQETLMVGLGSYMVPFSRSPYNGAYNTPADLAEGRALIEGDANVMHSA